jgi:hypothetical protein
MSKLKLQVVAPQEMWVPLELGLAVINADLEFTLRPAPGPTPRDPFGLAERISTHPSTLDGVLLVAPRRNAPGRLAPALLVAGVPVALVQADHANQLQPWFQALESAYTPRPQRIWASLAMGKDFYLGWGNRLFDWMQAGGKDQRVSVQNWLADRVSKTEICQNLATGPRLAIYIGHARARGWSGYQALRWEHIAAVEQQHPCGILITLGCRTLSRTRGVVPFGCRWINEGRAAAYLAPAAALKIPPGEQITQALGEQLAAGKCQTIGQLLVSIASVLSSAPQFAQAYKEFLAFRLMGNPFQPID